MAGAETATGVLEKHGEQPLFCSVPPRQAEIGKALALREFERLGGVTTPLTNCLRALARFPAL
jgi:hypothetical protein